MAARTTKTTTAKDTVYIATESGSADIKGDVFIFVKDITRVRGNHPLLKVVPDYFAPVDDSVTYEVQTATKAPGEKRGGA